MDYGRKRLRDSELQTVERVRDKRRFNTRSLPIQDHCQVRDNTNADNKVSTKLY